MKKMLGAAIAAGVLGLAGGALVIPAQAASPAATVSPGYDSQATPTDVSAQRYYRRYPRRYYAPRYYRPYYAPYGYYSPYYRPSPYYGYGYARPGIGFSFGF